jgi:hypothetical protein
MPVHDPAPHILLMRASQTSITGVVLRSDPYARVASNATATAATAVRIWETEKHFLRSLILFFQQRENLRLS